MKWWHWLCVAVLSVIVVALLLDYRAWNYPVNDSLAKARAEKKRKRERYLRSLEQEVDSRQN